MLLKKLKNKLFEYMDFSDIVLLLSFVLVGGFNDYIACLLSALLLANLFFKIRKNNKLNLKLNLFSVSVAVIFFFYGLCIFWAIDSGMALIGFLKFLPIVAYMISVWQSQKTENLLRFLPFFAALLTVISSIGSLILPISDLFLVSERLSGFFQYPNTFALFLLISELLLLKKTNLKILDYITLGILIGGLLYTGSRTVFLLFLLSNFLMFLLNTSKKTRILIIVSAIAVLGLVAIFAFFGESGNVLSRYFKIGLTQSTFIGRLLYIVDAFPLLMKYPFGMGYLGYHFLQGSIQTGVYNVSYVHNDFLQVALDVGIVPAVLFLWAVVSFFLKKNVSLSYKIIAGVFVCHSMFDFNMQFVGMFMLFILLTNENSGKTVVTEKLGTVKILLPVFFVISIYMCVALTFSQFLAYETSDKLYPFNTRNKLLLLEQQEDVNVANEIAQEILNQNTVYYAPYSIKAKYAYSKGDFIGVIQNKNAVFERNVFRYTEYREYCIMLINGILAYEQNGDYESADVLKKELLRTAQRFENNANRLSKLGSMIDEQPVKKLPDDVLDYIQKITQKAGDSD